MAFEFGEETVAARAFLESFQFLHGQEPHVGASGQAFPKRGGITHKAVMAFRSVIKNGYRFSEPESVSQARDSYRGSNSTVISFYGECMAERPEGSFL